MKLDKDVQVAFRVKSRGEHGTKEREFTNAIALAESANRRIIELDLQSRHINSIACAGLSALKDALQRV